MRMSEGSLSEKEKKSPSVLSAMDPTAGAPGVIAVARRPREFPWSAGVAAVVGDQAPSPAELTARTCTSCPAPFERPMRVYASDPAPVQISSTTDQLASSVSSALVRIYRRS